jgi:hypothetical protein
LIEIQLNVVSAKFKEVTGSFVGSAESKGVRKTNRMRRGGQIVWIQLDAP